MTKISEVRVKRPGRPEGGTRLKENILDAAEILFADLGYAGTSMRIVAEKVDVTAALITYYFGSKENLFREVFQRKGREVAKSRMAALQRLSDKGQPIEVHDLVQAFLEPVIKLRKNRQGTAFLRLHSRLHMEPKAITYDMRRKVYDESTHAYARVLSAILPHLDEAAIYRRMSLMIGAYLYAFSDTNRLQELLPSKTRKDNLDYDFEEIVRFVTAGMLAPPVDGGP